MVTITEPSVKSLLLEMRFNGQPLAVGTGFVVQSAKGPVLLTNRHNVTGRNNETGLLLSPLGAIPNELVILHNQLNNLGTWVPRIEPLYQDETPLWREHPHLGPRADFVALPLTQLNNVELYPYSLENPAAIQIGPADVISVVGFPFGMQAGGSLAIWATGFIASEPGIDYANLPIFLIDCRSRPGQSGSAVIVYKHGGMVTMQDGSSGMFAGPLQILLGIYSGRINEQSDIGIVWKRSALKELIDAL